MTNELVPERWAEITERVALQHNSEIKCAVQLVVETGEEIEVTTLRKRLLMRTDSDPTAEVPESAVLKKSLITCFIPNGTFTSVGVGQDMFQKIHDPSGDALAGHALHLSQLISPKLDSVLGRTNISHGVRRAPVFALGILRHLDKTEEPLSAGELARRLDTSSATIIEHIHNLGSLGVLTYVERGKHTSGSVVSYQFSYPIKRFIHALEGVAKGDPTAINEGIILGQNVVSKPKTLAGLIGKRRVKPSHT